MGNSGSAWWTVVECACRILGVSTATVLCAVGVETVQQGEFNSLGIYLITSSVSIMMFELAYFLDFLLSMCVPLTTTIVAADLDHLLARRGCCPPNWQVFVLWGKMARVGGFHKFLYYSIMSVVCFLHPVLVWHAIIPGSMLLVTAFFNFILSKKAKSKSPKSPPESNGDQSLTTVCVTERSGSNGGSSFFQAVAGIKRGEMALTDPDDSFEPQERGESVQAMLEQGQTVAPAHTERRKRRWKEMIWFREREEPVEREMEEMNESEPDTTSDTAPMITD